MTTIIESVDFVRKIISSYGSEFKGFYLAIIITFAVIAICNLKNKTIRSYIIYCIVILLSLLAIGFLDYALGFIPKEDVGGMYDFLPTILLIIIGFVILLPFLVRKREGKKKKVLCTGIALGVVLVFLVEASVPLEWTLKNFTTSRLSNPYHSDVEEIADTVGTGLVLLPEEYKIQVKECNKNANVFESSSSHYDESATPVFKFASLSNVDYVVIKKKDFLGNTNETTLNKGASSFKYENIKDLGDYIIYGSNNVAK